ncbi:MAG: hypothetical protein GX285_00475 [Clostridiales bacterium]|jgi:hypothetical protein|nr:hypothetical protein [Clostridiales bacterium]HRV29607.1 hypothetical protein [Spirochaetia bacterium]
MKEIVGMNFSGQVVIYQLQMVKNDGESYQDFLDNVNSNVNFDPRDKDALMALDFSTLGNEAKMEACDAVENSNLNANDIIKDHNTIVTLQLMAEDANDKITISKIMDIRKNKFIEPIMKMRKIAGVKTLHGVKLVELLEIVKNIKIEAS